MKKMAKKRKTSLCPMGARAKKGGRATNRKVRFNITRSYI
jgi:hypothetical protein